MSAASGVLRLAQRLNIELAQLRVRRCAFAAFSLDLLCHRSGLAAPGLRLLYQRVSRPGLAYRRAQLLHVARPRRAVYSRAHACLSRAEYAAHKNAAAELLRRGYGVYDRVLVRQREQRIPLAVYEILKQPLYRALDKLLSAFLQCAFSPGLERAFRSVQIRRHLLRAAADLDEGIERTVYECLAYSLHVARSVYLCALIAVAHHLRECEPELRVLREPRHRLQHHCARAALGECRGGL